jgi:hypothetical protein
LSPVWTVVAALGEVLAAAGVIVSLLYLGRQIRLSAASDRRARYDALLQEATAWNRTVATQADLAGIVLRGMVDRESLDAEERFRFHAILLPLLRTYESIVLYRSEGELHDWGPEGFEKTMRDFFAMPGVQAYWRDRSDWFVPEARRKIDEMIAASSPKLTREYSSTTHQSVSQGRSPLSAGSNDD